MCGIVGVIIKASFGFTKKTEDIFHELLFVDTLRGSDSTGIIGAENDASFHIAKEACTGPNFIPQLKADAITNKMFASGKAYIGHNRKKTVGEIKDETAHPFVVDDTFAMVHNGTLYQHEKLHKESETDSQALAHVLKKAFEGDHKSVEEALSDVYGAYAVAAYDQTKHKVYLLRNKERPLAIIETTDAWYFASEGPMLSWILWRNGYESKTTKYIPVEENTIFSFDLKSNTLSTEKIEPKKSKATHTGKKDGVAFGVVTKDVSDLSSKELKRIKKAHIGRRLFFWIDDFVEEDYPNTIEKGSTSILCWAGHDEFKFKHSLSGVIDLQPLLQPYNIRKPEDLYDLKWSGYVDKIEYMEEYGNVLFTLTDIKPVPKSDNVFQVRKDYETYLESLSDGELLGLMKDKTKLVLWQLSCVHAEMKARANAKVFTNENTTSLH